MRSLRVGVGILYFIHLSVSWYCANLCHFSPIISIGTLSTSHSCTNSFIRVQALYQTKNAHFWKCDILSGRRDFLNPRRIVQWFE